MLRISCDFAAESLGKPYADVYGSRMTTRTAFVGVLAAAICFPATAMAMASAEMYTTKGYYYGRFDARVRFAPGDGVVSAFFLWKEGSEVSGAYWNELDIEKFSNCSLQTNIYYGNPATQHSTKPSVGDLCSGYHDYRIEWTPTYLAFSIDGKEIRRDTGDAPNGFAQNASAGMTFHFNIWPGNQNFGGNIANTTLPVQQYISWVQYSSYDNGNFTVQWREEFDGPSLPSGWALGDWSSVYNLSTHTPQNVSFVNGIAVMSLTADNAIGYQGTPPVDPNAGTGGTASTGGATSVSGGATGTGGMKATGGATGNGGTSSVGGVTGTGGTKATGGTNSVGGATGNGGTNSFGGVAASGGNTSAVGGKTSTGGSPSTGGATASAGTGGSGDTTGSGGANASGGKSPSGGGANLGGTTASVATASTGGSRTSGGSISSGGSLPAQSTLGTSGSVSNSSVGKSASENGCGCSTGSRPSPFGTSLLLLTLVGLRRRRK